MLQIVMLSYRYLHMKKFVYNLLHKTNLYCKFSIQIFARTKMNVPYVNDDKKACRKPLTLAILTPKQHFHFCLILHENNCSLFKKD